MPERGHFVSQGRGHSLLGLSRARVFSRSDREPFPFPSETKPTSTIFRAEIACFPPALDPWRSICSSPKKKFFLARPRNDLLPPFFSFSSFSQELIEFSLPRYKDASLSLSLVERRALPPPDSTPFPAQTVGSFLIPPGLMM